VIGSRLGALVDIIDDERTGLLCDAGDPEAFASAIECLLSDPSRLASLSTAAKTYSRQHLSPTANLGLLEAIYRDCQSRRAAVGDKA
jgi:glycosyltransferase involved in cell wall biosynthesis